MSVKLVVINNRMYEVQVNTIGEEFQIDVYYWKFSFMNGIARMRILSMDACLWQIGETTRPA